MFFDALTINPAITDLCQMIESFPCSRRSSERYSTDRSPPTSALVLFALVGLPCSFIWLAFGQAMRQWLQDPVRLRIFNVTMAVALVASLYPMLTT